MELTKIEIENYKSIKSPVAITFSKDLPTVLIGKNGSGKTNVLEALSAIALANTNYYGNREKEQPTYRAYIQLSEEDVATMLPDVVYDKNKCEIIAYSSGNDLKIDRVRSEYIVSSIRKEIADIRDLASQLKDAVDLYEKQLTKISHDGYEELPIHCYNIKDENGRLTNYNVLHWQAEHFIDNVRKVLDNMLQTFEDDEAALTFVAERHLYFGWHSHEPFRLEYVEPSLAKFEQKFVSINKTAIKREITKINKATKDACDRIDYIIKEIEDRTKRIQEGLDTYHMRRQEQDERYYSFLRHVQHIIGKRCLFLKNESNDVIFRKEDRNYYYYDHSNSIMETYLRQVYEGSDREELLRSSKNELTLSEQAVADFEVFLNENIPSSDREMYDSISVQAGGTGHISIFLNEKTGEQINLNETSAGRRWYFTYYFMKNILSEGDIFIIDEPAAMLHPSAQKEIMLDLIDLVKKRGIKVIYSTHSPYLIPAEWSCVKFVSLCEGTKVIEFDLNTEEFKQFQALSSIDIFGYEEISEYYEKSSFKDEITKGVYRKLIENFSTNKDISDRLGIDERTLYYWQSAKKVISLKNIIKVALLLKIDPLTLMKETE